MSQKHLFVMDPIEKLNFKLDSSLRMAFELQRRGHKAFFTLTSDISWTSTNLSPIAQTRQLSFSQEDISSLNVGDKKPISLNSFAGIHMRKEPPFDMSYITCTWLLDAAKDFSRIYNKPSSLRAFNEKLGILQFPHAIQPALVSSNTEEIINFTLKNCQGDAIIKPLDLYGGKGIFRFQIQNSNEAEAKAKIIEATKNGSELRIVQKFDKAIFEGELRVFSVGGKILNWCLKKPKDGDFLANTGSGATLHDFTPSEELRVKIEKVALSLYKKNDISITGMDIIGENISEINITSPRLLQADSDKINYYEEIATWIEQDCESFAKNRLQ